MCVCECVKYIFGAKAVAAGGYHSMVLTQEGGVSATGVCVSECVRECVGGWRCE